MSKSSSDRPKNREEIYDRRQKDALADLAELRHAGGILGGDARGAAERMKHKLEEGREIDYGRLANPGVLNLVLARLPLIILCAVIIAGLAAKYLF